MPKAKTTGTGGAAAKKSRAPKGHKLAEKFPNGEILRDLCKKNWRLGDVIGQGGFGLIYLASDKETASVGPDADYVVKIEPISNGPLFCELHFYQRVAKPDLIDAWVKSKKLKYLGVPKYIASGQHMHKGVNYRFMVMERFSTDLQKIFEGAKKRFSKESVYALALRMIDALEYLHENHYIHADIKASNCLLGYKHGKTDVDSIHLVDFGLAAKYAPNGTHREYKEDPRKAHDGTVEFTSVDAHKGVEPSRRGDMEILGFCLLQWLCGRLPWEDKLSDKDYVRDAKVKYMNDIPSLMKKCFPQGGVPAEISTYLTMVKNLNYEEKPDYNKMREIFTKGLSQLGIKDTWKLHLPIAGASKITSPKPKKAVKRPLKDTDADEPVVKLKSRAASPKVKSPNTPSTSTYKPTTPKAGKSSTPTSAGKKITKKIAAKSPSTGRITDKGVTSPGRRVTSPSSAKARAVGAKAIAGIMSPLAAGDIEKSENGTPTARTKHSIKSPAGSPAPKKRKVVRKKHVLMSEIAVQTSPSLKKNS